MVHSENATSHSSGRVLGLDVGARRIGIAVSDPLGFTAQGISTLHRRNRRYDLAALRKLLSELEMSEIGINDALRIIGQMVTHSQEKARFAVQNHPSRLHCFPSLHSYAAGCLLLAL